MERSLDLGKTGFRIIRYAAAACLISFSGVAFAEKGELMPVPTAGLADGVSVNARASNPEGALDAMFAMYGLTSADVIEAPKDFCALAEGQVDRCIALSEQILAAEGKVMPLSIEEQAEIQKARLDRKEAELDKRIAERVERDKRIAERVERDKRIAEKRERLAELDKRIAEKKKRAAEQAEQLAIAEAALGDLDTAIERVDRAGE